LSILPSSFSQEKKAPKKVAGEQTVKLAIFFEHSGSVLTKAVCRTLMKLTLDL